MDVSELTLKLVLILIPGAIASMMFEKLTVHRKWTPFQFVTNSIIFGGLSYIVAWLGYGLIHSNDDFTNFWANLPTKEIQPTLILKGTSVAPVIALVFTWLDYNKVLNWLGKKIHITNKYGDENLYTYFLNSQDVGEVYIRDMESNLTYQGFVDAFSETDKIKEITLIDVRVYRYIDSVFLYEVKSVYLARPKDKLVIELPKKGDNNDVQQE